MKLKNISLLSGRQRINLAALALIPLILFLIWGAITENARHNISELPEVILANSVSEHINVNRAKYDMLNNSNPQYVPRDVFEGADANNFTKYFGTNQTELKPSQQ